MSIFRDMIKGGREELRKAEYGKFSDEKSGRRTRIFEG